MLSSSVDTTIDIVRNEEVKLAKIPLKFTDNGRLICILRNSHVALNEKGTIHIYNVSRNAIISIIPGYFIAMTSTLDGDLITANSDEIRLWRNLEKKPESIQIAEWPLKDVSSPCSLVVSSNNKLYTAAGNGQIEMWDIKENSKSNQIAGSSRDYINPGLRLTAEGDVACWSWCNWESKCFRIWDKDSHNLKKSFKFFNNSWLGELLPNNRAATLLGSTKSIRITNMETQHPVCIINTENQPTALAVTPNGWLISGNQSGVFQFFDVDECQLISTLKLDIGSRIYRIALDLTSSKVLVACEDGFFNFDCHIINYQKKNVYNFFKSHKGISDIVMNYLHGDQMKQHNSI